MEKIWERVRAPVSRHAPCGLVEMCDVGKVLRGKVALREFSLSCLPHQITLIIHEGGSEDVSMVLKLMLGLVAPTSGTVHLNSLEIEKHPRSMNIQYLPKSDGLLMNCSVFENVAFFGRLLGMTQDEVKIMYDRLQLQLGGVSPRSLIREMPTSEVKKVDLFIATMSVPDLLVAEELTEGLSEQAREEMWAQISNLKTNHGTTIVLSSRSPSDCYLADRIFVFSKGFIIEGGSVQELCSAYKVESFEEVLFTLMAVQKYSLKQLPIYLASSEDPHVYEDERLSRRQRVRLFHEFFLCQVPLFRVFRDLLWLKWRMSTRIKLLYLSLSFVVPLLVMLVAFWSSNLESGDKSAVWGLMVAVMFACGTLMGFQLVQDDPSGALLDKMRTCGISVRHIELTKVVFALLILLGTFVTFGSLHLMDSKPFGLDTSVIILVVGLVGVGGLTAGMLLALALKPFEEFVGTEVILSILALVLSGFYSEGLFYNVSQVFPQTQAIESLKLHVIQNLDLADCKVWNSLSVALLWISGTFSVYYFVRNRELDE